MSQISNYGQSGTPILPPSVPTSFDVDNGANVVPVANVLQVSGISGAGFVPSGIETHNGGGAGNDLFIEDRRWISPYVVDASTVVGERGTFTTVQAALDAAAAVGRGTVIIRPGTYTENLTLHANVNIVGLSVDGRISIVEIVGNHTLSEDGPVAIEKVLFTTPVGDTFTINPAAPDVSLLGLKFCGISTVAGTCFVISPGAGTIGAAGVESSNFSAALNIANTTETGVFNLTNTVCSNSTAGQALFVLDDTSQMSISNCDFDSQGDVLSILSANCTATFSYNSSRCNGAFVNFTGPGLVNAYHSIINANDPSGNYVIGAGTLSYGDQLLLGSAINIDPATTQVVRDWKAYATDGTSVTATKGTAAFDATQFTVTNGFVQLTGSAPSNLTYTNVNTTPYVVLTTDQYISVDSSGGARTIQLPNAAAIGQVFVIKDRTGSANTNAITVTTVGGAVLIDGATTYVMNTQFAAISLIFNSTSYEIY